MKLENSIVEKVKAAAFDPDNDFLVAMSNDYPDFYKIPMHYLDATRRELRKAGFKFRIFFLGPRHRFDARTTLKSNATSFRVVFYEI